MTASTLPTLALLEAATASSYRQQVSLWIAEAWFTLATSTPIGSAYLIRRVRLCPTGGTPGARDGELGGPSGLAFDSEDNLYVADHLNNRIQKFTSDGLFLLTFGSEGAGDGQFNLPWGLTVDPKGEVYVADWRNDRIQRFSPDGEFLAKYGNSGHGDGEFYRPSSVAVDSEGYIYVADWGNERVQVLGPSGDFVTKLRGEATLSAWAQDFLNTNVEEAETRAKSNLEPQFDFFEGDPFEESSHVEKYFWAPVSVKFTSDGRLCVTECNRHRIQIYTRGP